MSDYPTDAYQFDDGYESMFIRQWDENEVQISKFEGKTICGKRGGRNYLMTTRVDPETKKCPGIYVPCSTETSNANTICRLPEETSDECPITFIDFAPVGTDVPDSDVV